jgi:ribose/xylose/arabinose/galactoside ABC-type transport system permease subunit
VLALAVGLSCGLANGVLITFGRLPPFIAAGHDERGTGGAH